MQDETPLLIHEVEAIAEQNNEAYLFKLRNVTN